MSITRHHNDWLSLLDISGPFLSMPVLLRVFPHGLTPHDPETMRAVRQQHARWADNQYGLKPDPAIHIAWVRFVLTDVLGYTPDILAEHSAIPEAIKAVVDEQHEVIRPDMIVRRASRDEPARMLIHVLPVTQDVEKPLAGARWKASPATRMAELLRTYAASRAGMASDTGDANTAHVPLGLVTNGEHWMLVYAPPRETSTFASWYATLWQEEPVTLRSFCTLLDMHRCYGVAANDTLDALFAESATNQQEVTDQLGYQVRQAVEMLVQTIDRLDKDTGRMLLRDTSETVLYEAALTVMMRLVFLFCAEERGLLRLGDNLYDEHYAVSTLRSKLREAADQYGEEVLERRHDAWCRLLALFRLVHGGLCHHELAMPAYGGSLFDPARYPFLEGLQKGTGNREQGTGTEGHGAAVHRQDVQSTDPHPYSLIPIPSIHRPLMVDNRTVLHLLEALQILRVKVPGGGPAEPRRLSFRALDIEQIGHVYEGLLDHTAQRASEPVLGLVGTKDREPELPLSLLEAQLPADMSDTDGADGEQSHTMPSLPEGSIIPHSGQDSISRKGAKTQRPDKDSGSLYHCSPVLSITPGLLALLKEHTGRSESALRNALTTTLSPHAINRIRAACDNDDALFRRVVPFAGIVRWDTFGRPVVITQGSVYVTEGTERRASGTHYTPRSLTESVVQHTLDPLVFDGPAEGLPRNEWRLRAPEHILSLTVCDMAMGSGAFLVQACRYLAERLVEAVEAEPESRAAGRVLPQRHKEHKEPDKEPESQADSGQNLTQRRKDAKAGQRPDKEPDKEPEMSLMQGHVDDEQLTVARRLIANRCLYGVDKNPLAVEIAKLSLWLTTLQKDKPFTFLDHALKCGDSLLGVSVEQLEHWSLDVEGATQHTYLTYSISWARDRALALRRRIAATPVLDVKDAQEKASLLHQADEAMALVKLAADLLAASVLLPAGRGSHAKPQSRKDRAKNEQPRERFLAYALERVVLLANAWEDMHAGRFTAQGEQPAREDFAHLRAEADQWLGGVRPFHWELEFPEVFSEEDAEPQVIQGQSEMPGFGEDLMPLFAQAAQPAFTPGFSAIIGNPPFMGGQRITGGLGTPYRDYLVEHLAGGTRGSADLCAYFFLRSRAVLQPGGMAGLLATNTIAQGDTREVGLDQLVQKHGYTIPRAVPSRPWPGAAGVVVAHIWLRRGTWRTPYVLDDTAVQGITPYLTVPGKAVGTPYRLAANAGKSFVGSYVLSMGFVLEPDEAHALIDKDPRNKDVLFPYLNGQDLNTSPDQSPSRWVINFFDWTEERAATYPDCWQIIQEKVRPERQRTNEKGNYVLRKPLPQRYWHYGEKRPALYSTIAGMERVLVTAIVSKYVNFVFQPANIVFMHKLSVFPYDNEKHFALLQSTIHTDWAWFRSSTLGGSTINYSASDCFETFPFPSNAQGIGEAEVPVQNPQPTQQTDPIPHTLHPIPSLEEIGERYHEHRRQIMLARQEGLTKTYNRFHNPDEMSEDIAQLRALHVQMDEAVAAAYGWGDLDLGHGFHETKQGVRYTICEAARREVLDRLLALNHERHAAEAEGAGKREEGRGKKKGKGKGTRGRKKQGEQDELF